MKHTEEVWKDVVGYEGLYIVSNHGNVASLSFAKTGKVKLIASSKRSDADGYRFVTLYKKGKDKKMLFVHRVVGIAFIPNPENKTCINHLNGIKFDNRLENLAWCTYSENERHSLDVLGKKRPAPRFGKDSPFSLPVEQYDLEGNFIAKYAGQKEAYRITGVDDGSISKCVNGIFEKAGGFIWRRG